MAVAKPKRYRWVCPDCEAAIHAPSRMKADDVRRFCLECSGRTGFLVARACPVLDAKRSAKRKRAQQKAATKAKRKRQKTWRSTRSREAERAEQRRVQKELAAWRRAHTERREPTEFDVGITTNADYYRGLGVRVVVGSFGRSYVPAWAFAIDKELANAGLLDADRAGTYEGLGGQLVRWVYNSNDIRSALNALIAGQASREELVRFMLEHYPFPIPQALRERYL